MAKRNFRLLEKQLMVAAVLVLFVLSCCGAPLAFAERNVFQNYQNEAAVYKLVCDANKLDSEKRYQEACTMLKNGLNLDPNSYSAEVHYRLGSALHGLKKNSAAIEELKLSLKFDPKYEWSFYKMAYVYRDMHDFDNAVEAMTSYKRLTQDAINKKDAQNSINDFRAADVYAFIERARKSMDRRRFKDAVRILKVAEAKPATSYQSDIYANLAFALEHTGEAEEAIVYGQKALKLTNDPAWILYTIALSYIDLGDYEQAISYFEQYVASETDEKSKRETINRIRDLKDDRDKVNPALMNKPDYLDEMKKRDHLLRWPANRVPITVYIPESCNLKGYKPAFRNYVIKSLDTWCSATGNKLDYKLVDDKSKALLLIEWTTDPLTLKENGRMREKAGITYPTVTWGNKIDSVVIRVRTIHGYDTEAIGDSEAFQVCMHEVGHAMGLDHSPSVRDVMFFGWSRKQDGLPTKRDKATIAKLYSDYSKVAFVPKAPANSIPADLDETPPPPFFMPIKVADNKPLPPPMFVPPPVEQKKQLPPPPMFTPPPVSTESKFEKSKSNVNKPKQMIPPMFTPPPKD